MKDVNVSREKQTDRFEVVSPLNTRYAESTYMGLHERLVRGLREGYVGVVKKRIEWSEQKREEISRSLPQSPSAFLKTLKKSKGISDCLPRRAGMAKTNHNVLYLQLKSPKLKTQLKQPTGRRRRRRRKRRRKRWNE